MMESPNIVIVAGPNGAGKSTAAPELIRDYLDVSEFVNADVIAQGISGFHPEGVAIQAGRVMLARLKELAQQRISFSLETTLAAKSYANWLRERRTDGYQSHLIFLWLPSPEGAIARVADRVSRGTMYQRKQFAADTSSDCETCFESTCRWSKLGLFLIIPSPTATKW